MVVFPFPIPSDAAKTAIRMCEMRNIPYIIAPDSREGLTADVLREFYDGVGIHALADVGEVVYFGRGFAALHSTSSGEKRIKLPYPCRVRAIVGTDACEQVGETIKFTLRECGTAIFRIDKI